VKHCFDIVKGYKLDNLLCRGDNLEVLKGLTNEYDGKFKCVVIDPPYNTGKSFSHYRDAMAHYDWLNWMRERLDAIHRLMSDDGSLWVTIDDNEAHYLKVMCDDIFGRNNFVVDIAWQRKPSIANDAKWFSKNHDHILVYTKNKNTWKANRLTRPDRMNEGYSNPDNHPKGVWIPTSLHAKSGTKKNRALTFTFINGVTWSPPPNRFALFSESTLRRLDENGEIWFGKNGTAQPSRKTFLAALKNVGIPPQSVWLSNDAGHNQEATKEVTKFNPHDRFPTAKPERLLKRILDIATKPGDLVLDCFAGSGTTGAVAHKMGRRWVMIELGDSCVSCIIPRLDQVISGEDKGGVTTACAWPGGGSYTYVDMRT
jgi:adenine-specific DNA-methyltransferase